MVVQNEGSSSQSKPESIGLLSADPPAAAAPQLMPTAQPQSTSKHKILGEGPATAAPMLRASDGEASNWMVPQEVLHEAIRALQPYSEYLSVTFGAYAVDAVANARTVWQQMEARDGPVLSAAAFLALLRDHRVQRRVLVRVSSRDGLGGRVHRAALETNAALQAFYAASGETDVQGCINGWREEEDADLLHSLDGVQFLEALARCGLHKYKDASFLAPGARAEGAALNLLGLADEEGVLNFGAKSFKPARFDFLKVPRLEGENDARRALWRQLWPRIDLAMIDEFPAWERPVHDLLQGNLSALAAVFLGYAPMGEKDWLQLLKDACPGMEGLPGSAVFRAVVPAGRTLSFHRFLLALCLMAEHLANPHKRYQIEWAPVPTKGAAAAAAAAKVDEVASEPAPEPAKKTLGKPAFAKSKPKALAEALDDFLQQNLLTPGHCKRSPVLTLHAELAEDSALQVMMGDFKPQLQQLHDLAAAPGAGAAAEGSKKVSIARFLWLFADRGLMRELRLRNTALGVLPGEDGLRRTFTVSLHKDQVHAAFLDSQQDRLWASLAPKELEGGATKQAAADKGGLNLDGFIEALVRCADLAWREVALMERSVRFRAVVRCLLKQATEEESLNEVLTQWAPPMYTPLADADQRAGESDAQFALWRKVWKRIELRDLAGFKVWEYDVHRALHENFLQLCSAFIYYTGVGAVECERLAGLAMKPRSELGRPCPLLRQPGKDQSAVCKLNGWLQLIYDAGLIDPVWTDPEDEVEYNLKKKKQQQQVLRAARLMAEVCAREVDGLDTATVEAHALTWKPSQEGDMVAAATAEATATTPPRVLKADTPGAGPVVSFDAVTTRPGKSAAGPSTMSVGSGEGNAEGNEGDGRRGPSRKAGIPMGARGIVKPKPKGWKPAAPPPSSFTKDETSKKIRAEAVEAAKKVALEAKELAKKGAEKGKEAKKEEVKEEGAPAPDEAAAAPAEAPKGGARARAKARAAALAGKSGEEALEAEGGGAGKVATADEKVAKNVEVQLLLPAFLELLCRVALVSCVVDADGSEQLAPNSALLEFEDNESHTPADCLRKLFSTIIPPPGNVKKLEESKSRARRAPRHLNDDWGSDAEEQKRKNDDLRDFDGEASPEGGRSTGLIAVHGFKKPPLRGVQLDTAMEWRRRVAADFAVQSVLKRLGPTLHDVFTPPTTGMMKSRPPAWRFGEFFALLVRCGLLADVQMPRLSQIVGDPMTATAFQLHLTPEMVARAWLEMRINPLPPGVRQAAPISGSAIVHNAMPHAPWMSSKGGAQFTGDFVNGGGLRLDEDGGGVDFDEWMELLIRVGEYRYQSVRCGLPPDDSSPTTAVCAEALMQHVAALKSEVVSLQEASRIPFPRRALNEIGLGLGESQDDFVRFKWLWGQLCVELERVHLWPSWEKKALDLLRDTGFPRLQGIFAYYVKARWVDAIDCDLPVTMGQEAWEEFVDDCAFATPGLSSAKLKAVFAQEVERCGGPLNVIQFVGLLVSIAFKRIHPEHRAGDLDKPHIRPVPECLRELLEVFIFPRANCDPSVEAALRLRKADGVIECLLDHKRALRALYTKLGGENVDKQGSAVVVTAPPAVPASAANPAAAAAGAAAVAAAAAATASTANIVVEKAKEDSGGPEEGVGLGVDEFVQLLEQTCEGWVSETVEHRSEITGEPATRTLWQVGLSLQQAVSAYKDSRNVTEWWTTRLSFNGFVQGICRCAESMFSSVTVMTPVARVDGMIKLVLKASSRKDLVDKATYVRAPPRFDSIAYVSNAIAHNNAKAQFTGSSSVSIGKFLDCWANMSLELLHGYPTWDKELYLLVQPYFATLCRFYTSYAAQLPRNEADLSPPPFEVWAFTLDMLPEHFEMLVTDMGLSKEAVKIFERMPLTTSVVPGVQTGSTPAFRGLPQFLSALILAAFNYANPEYETCAALGKIDEERLIPVPESVKRMFEHRMPLTLMRRCHVRLKHEVELAKALNADKLNKLQVARTRERNFLIEAAGMQKRGGDRSTEDDEDEDTPRRPRRHAEKIKVVEKKVVDPAVLHNEVQTRALQCEDFSRILKRKQADLALLETDLEPLLRAEGIVVVKQKKEVLVVGAEDDGAATKKAKPGSATDAATKRPTKAGDATDATTKRPTKEPPPDTTTKRPTKALPPDAATKRPIKA